MAPERDSPVYETWQRTLGQISTVLGRLAYLASLRDANTGSYRHFGIAQRYGETETDRILRRSHMDVFQQWLCFGLEQQKSEVEEYFAELGGEQREILANWLQLHPYGNWIPAESRDAERKLFNADLGVVLEIIRAECGVASPDPDS